MNKQAFIEDAEHASFYIAEVFVPVLTISQVVLLVNKHLPVTPARGEPMPKTIEHYQANALRDQDLILEQKMQIAKMSQTINMLRQRAGYLSGDSK